MMIEIKMQKKFVFHNREDIFRGEVTAKLHSKWHWPRGHLSEKAQPFLYGHAKFLLKIMS
jgi:hypothetical protein